MHENEAAEALHRLADVGELIAGGLYAIAAAAHTDSLRGQRDMAAVFDADARNRYGDIWKKLDEKQRIELERFIGSVCKGTKK